MGFMEDICKTVPKSNSKLCGLFLFILNILFPGLGTVIGAIADNCIGLQIIVGIVQFFLFPILFIGLVWSIMWGYKIWEKSGFQPQEGFDITVKTTTSINITNPRV